MVLGMFSQQDNSNGFQKSAYISIFLVVEALGRVGRISISEKKLVSFIFPQSALVFLIKLHAW